MCSWYYECAMKFKNGLLFGLIVGAVSAILYAPKSGKEIRNEVKEKINVVPKHFFNLMESLVDLTASVLDFAKEAFSEQSDKFSRSVSKGVNAAREKTEELRKFTSNIISR